MTTTPRLTPAQQTLFNPHELTQRNGRPTVHPSTPCQPRDVFATEAEFELHLKHDPEGLAVIGEALGIHAGLVTTQVRVNPNTGQRADLVLNPIDDATQPSIVELQLDPLDAEHVYRATLYAVMMRARDVAFIAPRMPTSTHTVFNELSKMLTTYRIPLRMHFLSLHTSYTSATNTATYELRLETQPRAQPPITLKALQAIAAFTIELGDRNLVGAKFDNARRIDIYRDLRHNICIRLAATRTRTTLSIMRVPAPIQQRLRRRHLPQRLATLLQPYGTIEWTPGAPTTEVVAAYHFPSVLTNDHTTDTDTARSVAKAFIKLHHTLRTALGDPTRARRARANIRYATRSDNTKRSNPTQQHQFSNGNGPRKATVN